MEKFYQINTYNLQENPFDLISKQWMLITSWNSQKVNVMTANWGGFGFLWGKNVAFCFVRKSRYSFSLIESNDFVSLCFLKSKHKDILDFCGKNSGKDIDKIKKTGLNVINDKPFIYFKESKYIFCCKKIYGQFLNFKNLDKELVLKNYPNEDFHKMFIFEIKKTLAAR